MRYKIFDTDSGEPRAYVNNIIAAVTAMVELSRQSGEHLAVKDEYTGVVL